MSTNPTITEFLEARAAEDEAEAEAMSKVEFFDGGWSDKQCQKVFAECAAKRAIIDGWEDPAASQTYASEVDDGYILAIDKAARALAAVYRDHPDYQQEWAL